MATYEIEAGGKVLEVEAPSPEVALKAVNELNAREPAKPPESTVLQKVQASVPGRILQGIRDPVDALSQLAPRGLAMAVESGATLPGPMQAIMMARKMFGQPGGDIKGNPLSDWLRGQAGEVDTLNAANEQAYQESRRATGGQGFDVARLAGNVVSPANAIAAPLVPARGAGLVVNAMRGGAAGGLGGVMQPVNEPANQGESFAMTKAAQAGLGAVTGAVVTPAISALGKSIASATNRLMGNQEVRGARASLEADRIMSSALKEIGHSVEDVPQVQLASLRQQVVSALKEGTEIDPAALLRKADFQALGIQGTAGQIARDPTQFARERNLRGVEGVGEPLQGRFTEQNRSLSDWLYGKMGGGQAKETTAAGEQMTETLSKFDKSMSKQVSAAYDKAREAAGKDAEVPLGGLAQDYAQVLRDWGQANVPGAIRSRIEEYGIAGGKQTKVMTAQDAEELLQLVNKHTDPMKKAEAGALGAIRNAIKTAVTQIDEAGGVFAGPRAMAAARFRIQDAVPALQAVAEGKAAPDTFVKNFILSGKAEAVQNLANVLDKASPEAATEARNQVGSHLARAAFGENMAGDKLFAPERFAKTLREMGTEKLKAFYSAEEIEQLFRVARVGAYINSQPSAAAVNYSNTAGAAMNLLQKIPGVPLAAAIIRRGLSDLEQRSFVSKAMAGEVPSQPAALPPEVMRRIGDWSSFMGAGAGAAEASNLR